MELRSSLHEVAGRHVLALEGTADLSALPGLHDALRRLTGRADTGALAVDLDGVTLLDDAALGLLLGAAARARRRGADLVVVCSSTTLLERLADTRFDRAVSVVADLSASGPPTGAS